MPNFVREEAVKYHQQLEEEGLDSTFWGELGVGTVGALRGLNETFNPYMNLQRALSGESNEWVEGTVVGLKLVGLYSIGSNVLRNIGLERTAIKAGSTSHAVNNPAAMAKKWQGKGAYPGVDEWTNVTIKKGTKVWGGAPGESSFYTTDKMIQTAGNDATKIFQGLQVGKGKFLQYRPGMTQYEVTQDITVGFSKALANSQYGPGGLEQYFIPDYESVLKPIKSIILMNR